MVKCDYCGEAIQHKQYKMHSCPTRKEIDEIKLDLTEMKAQLNQLCSSHEEMIKDIRSMMTYIKDNMTNTKQATNSSCHCRRRRWKHDTLVS